MKKKIKNRVLIASRIVAVAGMVGGLMVDAFTTTGLAIGFACLGWLALSAAADSYYR